MGVLNAVAEFARDLLIERTQAVVSPAYGPKVRRLAAPPH